MERLPEMLKIYSDLGYATGKMSLRQIRWQ